MASSRYVYRAKRHEFPRGCKDYDQGFTGPWPVEDWTCWNVRHCYCICTRGLAVYVAQIVGKARMFSICCIYSDSVVWVAMIIIKPTTRVVAGDWSQPGPEVTWWSHLHGRVEGWHPGPQDGPPGLLLRGHDRHRGWRWRFREEAALPGPGCWDHTHMPRELQQDRWVEAGDEMECETGLCHTFIWKRQRVPGSQKLNACSQP